MVRSATTAKMQPVSRKAKSKVVQEDDDVDEVSESGEPAEDEEDDKDGDDDRDGEEDDEDEEPTVEKHLELAIPASKAARKRFFTYTRSYSYAGKEGEYVIRGDCNENSTTDSMQYGWPQAFVGEEPQPVNAAMWLKEIKTKKYLLVAVWTFSPTGDETNVYHLDSYQDDIFDACGYGYSDINKEVITDEDVRHAFSISSGDNVEEKLYCPALENISIKEMDTYATWVPDSNRTREDCCEAHGENSQCMYCRHNKRARRN